MRRQEKLLEMLIEEQYEDGSFGRFHTMNTKEKKKIPTTEAAAWLMYQNGIGRDTEVCNKMCVYMEHLLCNLQDWPDLWEKNKYFAPAVPLFISSKLALFSSENKEYKRYCDIWISLLISAFEQGEYSTERTNEIAKKIIGVEIDHSCIGLQSLNNLALFAMNTEQIPEDIQKRYLHWLHSYDGKINYTTVVPKYLEDNKKNQKVISLLSKFKCFNDEYSNFWNDKNRI